MISEEQIDLLIERLIRRTEQANTYFLKSIGSSIKKISKLKPSEAQQLIQILKYGGNYDDIVKKIVKYTSMNLNEVEDIFKKYAKKDVSFAKRFYEYRNKPFVPIEKNKALNRQLEAIKRVARNEMYDFTRTSVLGYTVSNLDGTERFVGLRETYNEMLDEALLNVGQGKETFDSAMTRMMNDIGTSGLKTINYESGRSVRLDSAIRMHLKESLRELHNENQLIIGEEIDADGVEVSVHANPAIDHADVQGRQFSTVSVNGEPSEWEKLNTEGVAHDYTGKEIDIRVTSKKGNTSFRPISTLNCYHTVFSVILGVNEPEYNEEQLEEIKQSNEEGFDFDEKHYTNYEGTQLQRSLERKIREQKDVQILARESNNKELIADAQSKITKLTKKYRDLLEASGLPSRMDRMRVSGYRRVKAN